MHVTGSRSFQVFRSSDLVNVLNLLGVEVKKEEKHKSAEDGNTFN